MRLFIISFSVLLVSVGSACADTVTLSLPGSYTPGTPFTADIGLTPVSNLGLYNVEVVFQTTSAISGLLTVTPPTLANSGYVFGSMSNFFASSNASGNQLRVVLSDFILDPTGPNVVAGDNDRLSRLTLTPSTNLVGPISVFIDRTSLFIDDANGNTLLTDSPLPTGTLTPTNAVPAPAGLVMALIAFTLFAARRRASFAASRPVENR